MTSVNVTPLNVSSPCREAFINAMRKAAATVCVVTTAGPAGRFGVTVSAMTSVTADPPAVLVCINKGNFVIPSVLGNRTFSVNFLRHDQRNIAEIFAGRGVEPGTDRFSFAEWETLQTGSPILVDAAASFDCELAQQVEFGSHTLFIGTVVDAQASDNPPLIYHNRDYVRLAS